MVGKEKKKMMKKGRRERWFVDEGWEMGGYIKAIQRAQVSSMFRNLDGHGHGGRVLPFHAGTVNENREVIRASMVNVPAMDGRGWTEVPCWFAKRTQLRWTCQC